MPNLQCVHLKRAGGLIVVLLAGILNGCATPPQEPVSTQTIHGDYQQVGGCLRQALDREYPGRIKYADSPADGSIILAYEVTVGMFDRVIRDFEVTVARAGPSTASLTIREKPTLVGGVDYYTKKLIPIAEACAATPTSPPTHPPKLRRR